MTALPYAVSLLENIHAQARGPFDMGGLKDVTFVPGALEGDALLDVLKSAQVLGIRSKTRLTREMLEQAPNLLAIGCFCIGTDQVDLDYAQSRGIPVFNAPYSNTRSVAELVLGEVIMLMRRIPEKDRAAHQGGWLKAVDGACEVRGKTLGIIGYGHIGTQLSVMAESLGMRVVFYDVIDKLALGNAVKCNALDELLMQADVVSLHVPSTPQTNMMMNAERLGKMKQGAMLVNASRGNVVDLEALASAISAGKIGGAAVDVFPVEPANNKETFATPLQNLPNVILTPHIGGSTLEAQENIALEVADKLVRYVLDGSTYGSVNMPQVNLPPASGHTRFRHIHANVPGVLAAVNQVFSSRNLNIAAQYLQTSAHAGYVVIDIDGDVNSTQVLADLLAIPGTIRAF